MYRRGGGGGLMAATAAPPEPWRPASAAILCLVASLGCFSSCSRGGAAALTGGCLGQSAACGGVRRLQWGHWLEREGCGFTARKGLARRRPQPMGAGAGAAGRTRPWGAAARGAGALSSVSAPCPLPHGGLLGSCHSDSEQGCPVCETRPSSPVFQTAADAARQAVWTRCSLKTVSLSLAFRRVILPGSYPQNVSNGGYNFMLRVTAAWAEINGCLPHGTAACLNVLRWLPLLHWKYCPAAFLQF